jgi:hypothetical protein
MLLYNIIENRQIKIVTLTYKDFLNTKYWGLALSRIYGGNWNSSFKQDFSLNYKTNSWLNYVSFWYGKEISLTCANNTSYAVLLASLEMETIHQSLCKLSLKTKKRRWTQKWKFSDEIIQREKVCYSNPNFLTSAERLEIVPGKFVYKLQIGSRNFWKLANHLNIQPSHATLYI